MVSPSPSDFRTFLSTAILSDQQNISYRSLSRALKCHVNLAKRLLYEYYDEQNKRKTGSVYATYLIAGTRIPTAARSGGETNGRRQTNGAVGDDDEDDDLAALPSSLPPFSSSMLESSQQSQETVKDAAPQSPAAARLKTVQLVREEDLESTKAQFQEITGLHIYSLSPGKIPDLVALTDIGRGLFADVFSKEDPLLHNKTYGVIQNRKVRRRTRRSDIAQSVLVDAPKPQPQPDKKKEEQEKQTPWAAATKTTSSLKREENAASRPSSRDSTSTRDDKKSTAATTTTTSKRDARDIFKAFAKASAKAPPSKAAKEEEPQDTPMFDADDDEGASEDEALFLDTNTRKPATGSKRDSDAAKRDREDKAAKLRKMMDSDDEEAVESDATNKKDVAATATAAAAAAAAAEEEEEGGGGEVAWSDSDTEAKQKEKQAQAAQAAPAGPRRKRGKRKVIKKRTLKDDEGFLVTKEEEVWEDFSETDNDEPPPSKAKAPPPSLFTKRSFPATATASKIPTNSQAKEKAGSNSTGGKAAPPKKIKGDIRGFFGKK